MKETRKSEDSYINEDAFEEIRCLPNTTLWSTAISKFQKAAIFPL